MSNELQTVSEQPLAPAFSMDERELMDVLSRSLYPGASEPSIKLVISYCRASRLDPMQKPVHIVPMWDKAAGRMRDVVMPGIGLYRTQAVRSGEYAGMTEPEYGPDVTENIGGVTITYPAWCRVSVKRRLPSGEIAEFPAREFWKENYAVKGGKEQSIAPNAMWTKRPYGQITKCAEAQALRKAFPEFGAQPTADEMEGKEIDITPRQTAQSTAEAARPQATDSPERTCLIADLELVAKEQGIDAYAAAWQALTPEKRRMVGADEHARLKSMAQPPIEGEATHE